MIAITGASGQLGRLVIEQLLSRTAATNIVALVRQPEKVSDLKALGVDVRQADYNHPATLAPALHGVSKLLLISSSEVGQRVSQHQAVIDAAKAEGVSLFAYTSILSADTNPMMLAAEHKATEAAIAAADLPAVLLRNGWYTENYTQSISGVLQAGVVVGAAGEGVIQSASRLDYAEAAATVLTQTESQVGRVYELAGDTGFTLAQYAEALSRQTGNALAYHDMPADDFTQVLIQAGLPDAFATVLADAEVCASQGWLAESNGVLSRLIGRPTTPFEQTMQQALASA